MKILFGNTGIGAYGGPLTLRITHLNGRSIPEDAEIPLDLELAIAGQLEGFSLWVGAASEALDSDEVFEVLKALGEERFRKKLKQTYNFPETSMGFWERSFEIETPEAPKWVVFHEEGMPMKMPVLFVMEDGRENRLYYTGGSSIFLEGPRGRFYFYGD